MELGTIVTSYEVVKMVRSIHYREEDFYDGDLGERIEEYPMYELKEVTLSAIEKPIYYIDDRLVEDYKEMNPIEMPPIVLGYYDDESYLTIDGGHRVSAASKLGLKKIRAFAAIRE